MTRIAALYDIHGNLSALRAVLEDARALEVDRIVVGGDVLPGPFCGEVLDLLDGAPERVDFIFGNGDVDTLRTRDGVESTRVPPAFRGLLAWCAERLKEDRVEAIRAWPATLTVGSGEACVLFCHATPRDDNEIFTRSTPEEALLPLFESVGVDLVVCGHTHMQFDRTVGATRVVNAGSVGMPFGEPGAFWALLELPEMDGVVGGEGGTDPLAGRSGAAGPVTVTVELRKTAYDLEEATRDIRSSRYPLPEQFALVQPPPEQVMIDAFERVAIGRVDVPET